MMATSIWSIFTISLALTQVKIVISFGPIVETNVGVIRGLSAENGNYSMYIGIPYASVNKSNPFGDAIPYQKFEDIFEANDDSAICPQLYQFSNTIEGTLDCLNINVYVPSVEVPTSGLPVMVWIHGGSFRRGLGGKYLFGPSFLVKHDIVLVTINYRLGPYGFMCLDVPEISGNQGLKDQLLAMRWVKENIKAFGGDPNQITLFGESAGGHSVDFHLISDKELLYSKVILQTGSSLAATVLYEPDKEAPIKLANHIGYATSNLKEALQFLVTADTNSVVSAALNLGIQFKPCVEREYDGFDSFITKNWIDARIPKVANMPVLLGFNENELMINHIVEDDEHFNNVNIISEYLKRIFVFEDTELKEMEQLIHNFYFGDKVINKDLMWDLIDFDSDFTYIHPIQRTIRKYIKDNVGAVFYYMFSYSGHRNFYKDYLNATLAPGVGHADELGYLFDIAYMEPPVGDDLEVVNKMTAMWTNFAKTGNPIPETSDLLPIKWIPITEDEFHYMNINTNLTMDSRPLHQRMAFWDTFYILNKNLQRNFVPNTN